MKLLHDLVPVIPEPLLLAALGHWWHYPSATYRLRDGRLERYRPNLGWKTISDQMVADFTYYGTRFLVREPEMATKILTRFEP